MFLRVMEGYNDCQAIRGAWNRIVNRHSKTILHLDVTSTFEWTMTLWRNRLDKRDQKILLLERQGSIAGILPLCQSNTVIRHIKWRCIAPINSFYNSGRWGFLLDEPSFDDLDSLIGYLYENISGWDVFLVTLVDGSKSDDLLLELVNRRGYCLERISRQSSPYIAFEGSWQGYFGSLPKKFRWNLRNGEKKIKACGEVLYKTCESGPELDYFVNAMIEIERASWKESAGTSITARDYQGLFYKEFLKIAAEKRWFCGQLLLLNGEPIAYIYGLIYNSVFYDLKESYKAKYKELSPGHMLKTFAFEQLHKRNVALYDFMGLCDDYKMRWTDNTYSRSNYVLYNKTIKGQAARMSAQLARCMKLGRNFLKRNVCDAEMA